MGQHRTVTFEFYLKADDIHGILRQKAGFGIPKRDGKTWESVVCGGRDFSNSLFAYTFHESKTKIKLNSESKRKRTLNLPDSPILIDGKCHLDSFPQNAQLTPLPSLVCYTQIKHFKIEAK